MTELLDKAVGWAADALPYVLGAVLIVLVVSVVDSSRRRDDRDP